MLLYADIALYLARIYVIHILCAKYRVNNTGTLTHTHAQNGLNVTPGMAVTESGYGKRRRIERTESRVIPGRTVAARVNTGAWHLYSMGMVTHWTAAARAKAARVSGGVRSRLRSYKLNIF